MSYFTGDWEADNLIMEQVLDQVEFYSGTERKKMVKVSPKIGGSMLFGITWRGYLSPDKTRTKDEETGLYKTKVMDEYPDLKNIFREFAKFHFPKHEWEQVQMNKNFPCPPHKDSSNISESVLCCFGNFTGGETSVEYPVGTIQHNARDKPVKFNGAKHTHWVEPFDGLRYSLVFFSNKSVRKAIDKKKYNSI